MAILKLKLVESLSKTRYLREAKIDITQLSQPELDKILDIIRDSNDIGQINQIADILKVPSELKAPIVRSIIKYRSIEPKVNPIIHIYNNFDGDEKKINRDQLFTFYNILVKVPVPYDIVSKYFNIETNIVKSKDLNYLATLVAHLSDKYTAKKYKNGDGDIPSIETHLMDKDGKFKSTDEIKRLMDTFLTNQDAQTITLDKWFKQENITEYKKYIIDAIENDSVIAELNKDDIGKKLTENKDLFIEYIDDLFTKGNEKELLKLCYQVDIPETLKAYNNDKKLNIDSAAKVLSLIYSEVVGVGDSLSRSFTLSDILEKSGATSTAKKFKSLQDLINSLNIDRAEKISAISKLNLLKFAKFKTITDQLFNLQIPDGDLAKLPKILSKFLKDKVLQNYLYTTIEEALALKGILPSQGHKQLGHYLVNMSDTDTRSNYVNRFNLVWQNLKLRNQLLHAKITKNANGGFNWLQAIKNFLDDIQL